MTLLHGWMWLVAMACLAACGGLLTVLVRGWPASKHGWLETLVCGWVLGAVLLPAVLPWLWHGAPTNSVVLLWWLGAASVVLGSLLWWWRKKHSPVFHDDETRALRHDSTSFRWWQVALAAYLLVTFVLLAAQAMQTPTLPWDAWGTWLSRAEAQFGAPAFLPEVDFNQWATAEQGSNVWAHAAFYPGAMPRLAVLAASTGSGWSDAAVHLLWPCWWLMMGGVMWFGLRRMGASAHIAWLATAAVLSLPMMQAHAVLAGYADMPLACAVLMNMFALLQWQKQRSWRTGLWFLLTLALLPCIKIEGAIWMLLLLATGALGLFANKWRWLMCILGVVVLFGAMPWGGLPIPLPGLGVFKLQWGQADLGVMGVMPLHLRPVWREVASTLWLHPNWMLLWWVWPVLFVWRWRALKQAPFSLLGWFAALAWGFLFVLFFLSDASLWAKNLTSVNRILLQVTPALVAMVALMWAQPRSQSSR